MSQVEIIDLGKKRKVRIHGEAYSYNGYALGGIEFETNSIVDYFEIWNGSRVRPGSRTRSTGLNVLNIWQSRLRDLFIAFYRNRPASRFWTLAAELAPPR